MDRIFRRIAALNPYLVFSVLAALCVLGYGALQGEFAEYRCESYRHDVENDRLCMDSGVCAMSPREFVYHKRKVNYLRESCEVKT